ncbi:NAD-dependent epimerase/dehydratase family protein, partial [Candidatus Parvarchaeota archaeon]|nr:NAD-dependent epimerase/dehydratase family protein [Candidatus Parvarchaeota archaeon]
HLAAINGTKYFYEMPKQVLKVNMQGTINVIEALEKSSVKKFVYFSSSEIYGKPEQFPTDESHRLIVDDPKNPRWTYSASKIMGEIYTNTHCKSLGIDYAIIRPHNFYGPRMGNEHVIPEFIRRIVKNEEFTIQGDGSQRRSFCYIGDAIEAVVQAGARKTNGEAFNIGNDTEEYTILEVANLVAKAAGVKISPKFVELPKGGTTRRKPSIEKARKLLGYNPKVGLEEGIGLTYAWYKDDLKGR